VQIRRNLLELLIVIFVTVGAADLVEVLAFRLLRGERGPAMATAQSKAQAGRQSTHTGAQATVRFTIQATVSLCLLSKLPAHIVPVEHLEEGLHVLGAPVLVFHVVGMLPHVHRQHWLVTQGQRAVLVGSGFYGNSPVGQLDQPGPAAAKTPMAAAVSLSWKAESEPNFRSIALASSPVGAVADPACPASATRRSGWRALRPGCARRCGQIQARCSGWRPVRPRSSCQLGMRGDATFRLFT